MSRSNKEKSFTWGISDQWRCQRAHLLRCKVLFLDGVRWWRCCYQLLFACWVSEEKKNYLECLVNEEVAIFIAQMAPARKFCKCTNQAGDLENCDALVDQHIRCRKCLTRYFHLFFPLLERRHFFRHFYDVREAKRTFFEQLLIRLSVLFAEVCETVVLIGFWRFSDPTFDNKFN